MAEKHVGAHVKFAQQMIIAQIGLNAQTTHSQKADDFVYVCTRKSRVVGNGVGGKAGCNANDAGSARQHVT